MLAYIWVVLVAMGLAATAVSSAQRAPDPKPIAVLLEVEGAIGPATLEYLSRGFDEAKQRAAKLIVLRMDTPGGLASSMQDIVKKILSSSVPVATYVAPIGARAASAGTYIFYASHIAAMAQSTHLGAATPVMLGGGFGRPTGDEKDGKKSEGVNDPHQTKAVNDAVAFIRGLAELRGRNVAWAERSVREAATLTASQALAEGVTDFIADDLQHLLAQAHGRKVRVQDQEIQLETAGLAILAVEPNWRARILAAITHPNIAYLLLLAGIYGLLFEFLSPGAVFPGVVGAIALVVGLYALNLLPISYAGVGLLLVGIALMVTEALVPSFGVLGIGGIIAFALGSLFLFPAEIPGLRISPSIIVAATIGSAGFLVLALGAAWRAHRRKTVTGEAVLLGSPGRVIAWRNGEGEVHVNGERWRASSIQTLTAGQPVRVIERRDLTLLVEAAPELDREQEKVP